MNPYHKTVKTYRAKSNCTLSTPLPTITSTMFPRLIDRKTLAWTLKPSAQRTRRLDTKRTENRNTS